MYKLGEGTAKNELEAFRLIRLSADQGIALSRYNLGVMYEEGCGTDKNGEQQALELIQLAADQGIAQAQFQTGWMHYYGNDIYEKNKYRAFELFNLAASQGHAQAQCQTGLMYEMGSGTDKNELEAFKFYRLSADQGVAAAQYCLGKLYLEGKGVAKDCQTAIHFLQLAANQKHTAAKNTLREMNQQVYNNEQQTVSSSSHQSEAELSRLQNQPITEEIPTTQQNSPNHTVFAEAMVSLNEQQQAFQRVAIAKRGTFADAMSTLLQWWISNLSFKT